jgi:pyruvate,orthophosphate dikinase
VSATADLDVAATRCVFDLADVDPDDASSFGGKGAGLARMLAAGLTVPPAFVISTNACAIYRDNGNTVPGWLAADIDAAMAGLERATGRGFGTGEGVPLLVSVRSGAPVSMPGMMDTILNVGLDACAATRLADATGNVGFAIDTWLRFWRSFAGTVLDIDPDAFRAVDRLRDDVEKRGTLESFLALERAIATGIEAEGRHAPLRPHDQLVLAIGTVLRSWDNSRARIYREHHRLPEDMGTAVTVQVMVFGNLDARSGSGVAFSRDPNTGAAALFGEYLAGRQGEEIVSGISTPTALSAPDALPSGVHERLASSVRRLERIYRDAVDVEFTVESGKLYLLQVRPAKRTAQAAVRVAKDLVDETVITPREAVRRVSVDQVRNLLRPTFDPVALARATVVTSGIGSSPGHASGHCVLDADRAAVAAHRGEPTILMRPTTSPQDIRGMLAADGIVTARGGALSHAAVVSRAMDKPCVVGCEDLDIDLDGATFSVAGSTYPEGTLLSMDGGSGTVYLGQLPQINASRHDVPVDAIVAIADALSGCEVWSSTPVGENRSSASPAGIGPISLTDLLISTDLIDELIAAIDDLSQDTRNPAPRRRLSELAAGACRSLLADNTGCPIAIRLPNLGSPRAQRMISTWVELAPQLLLPGGIRAFYGPLLQGIAAAASDVGYGCVGVVIGGVTDARQLATIDASLDKLGRVSLALGASLHSLAALAAGPEMAARGFALWVDIRELIRTFHGFPSALSMATDVFDSSVDSGTLTNNPLKVLDTNLVAALQQLLTAAGRTAAAGIGIDGGVGMEPAMTRQLYAIGFRTFSVAGNQLATVRLLLGQVAAETVDE